MSDITYDVDPELKTEFVEEALDGLSELSELYIELENDPSNMDTVEAIFRVAHSIKGNAAYFELMKIKHLSHDLETLLDNIRKGNLHPTREVIDVLLAGTDELTAMMNRTKQGKAEIENETFFEELLQRVAIITTGKADDAKELWTTLFELLESIDELNKPDSNENTTKAISIAKNLASLLSPELDAQEEQAQDLTDIPEPLARLIELIQNPRKEVFENEMAAEVGELLKEIKAIVQGQPAQEVIDTALSEYEMFIDTIGVDPVHREMINENISKILELKPWPEQETQDTTEENIVEESTNGKAKQATKSTAKTMRIKEDTIDTFLAYVGDLVVIGEMYDHFNLSLEKIDKSGNLATDLRRINESFRDLSGNLQNSIMDIRKLPMRTLLSRAPRIIRDIANLNNKEIETIIEGEDILADKSLFETLEAPFVHMVRNSADHGIELPDDRQAAGKSKHGTVSIIAKETSDTLYLIVKDDGKGLDSNALHAKGVSMGLVDPDQEITQDVIVDLLFSSGVSTAAEVTDVSGRGVGMDVVKREIESMGGKIFVETTSGQGSEFRIELPKTVSTQILIGFEVLVGGKHYILPMNRIVRCFRAESDQIKTIKGKGECVISEDNLLAIYRFSDVCNERKNQKKLTEGILIEIEAKKGSVALHVDEIEGVKQVVLKEIKGLENRHEIFQGGAVMGDGNVAMVMDVDRFIELGQQNEDDDIEEINKPEVSGISQ